MRCPPQTSTQPHESPINRVRNWRQRVGVTSPACLTATMLALAVAARAEGPLLTPLAPASGASAPAAPWHVVGLPGQTKPMTRFDIQRLDGLPVLRIDALASYGNLVHPVPAGTTAHRLAWRWRLDQPNPASDLRQKSGDDNPVKVCALFDLPLDRVPFIERQLLRLARSRTGEPLPAATVCYVWDAHLPPGTVLDNVFSRRIRLLVLRGPEAALHTWQDEQRDIHADFLRLFGDETSTVPPLLGIAVAGDADNTQGHSVAHLATISLD